MYIYCERALDVVWRRKGAEGGDIFVTDGWEVLTPAGWEPRVGVGPRDLVELTRISLEQAEQIATANGLASAAIG